MSREDDMYSDTSRVIKQHKMGAGYKLPSKYPHTSSKGKHLWRLTARDFRRF